MITSGSSSIPRLATAVFFILAVSISGCWSRREIEDLAFVTMTGIDLGESGDEVVLTIHVSKPAAGGDGPLGQPDARLVATYSAVGATVAEASAKVADRLPRRITWAHSTIVAVGEDFARAGIDGLMDFLARSQSPRETAFLVLVKGARAADLMEAEFPSERLPSAAIMGIIERATHESSTCSLTSANDVRRQLETHGLDVVMAALELRPMAEEQSTEGAELLRDVITTSAEVAGLGVFRESRLVGWLNPVQTRGLQFIRGQLGDAILQATHPASQGGSVSLRVTQLGSRVKMIFIDDIPEISIAIEVAASIADARDAPSLNSPEAIRNLQHSLEGSIRAEVMSTVEIAVRELQSDVFGLGLQLYRSNPRRWLQLSDQWREILRQAEVRVEVSAAISYSSLLLENK